MNKSKARRCDHAFWFLMVILIRTTVKCSSFSYSQYFREFVRFADFADQSLYIHLNMQQSFLYRYHHRIQRASKRLKTQRDKSGTIL